jgi:hypothetical protein
MLERAKRDCYSPDDWAEICLSIQRIRPGEVPQEIRKALEEAAFS